MLFVKAFAVNSGAQKFTRKGTGGNANATPQKYTRKTGK